jgi:hypothetical protein
VSTQISNALVTSTSTALLALCQPNVTSLTELMSGITIFDELGKRVFCSTVNSQRYRKGPFVRAGFQEHVSMADIRYATQNTTDLVFYENQLPISRPAFGSGLLDSIHLSRIYVGKTGMRRQANPSSWCMILG